jgi:Protein of unknown function (DUF1572)
MRSRWTDFLTKDGEKPDRNRDAEFLDSTPNPPSSAGNLGDGWSRLFEALERLSEAGLGCTVTIRGEPHSVMQAVNRRVAHYALHVGQNVLLARNFAGHRWKSLSVPRNQSVEIQPAGGIGTAKPEINCRILRCYSKH